MHQIILGHEELINKLPDKIGADILDTSVKLKRIATRLENKENLNDN